jgi:hypothetical protein
MKGNTRDPARLREQLDPANLVERIAGQAARDVPEPAPLTAVSRTRIAAHIEARGKGSFRLPPRGWLLAMGAFLLGIATAASAAHLDLVPRWIDRIIHGTSAAPAAKPAPRKPVPRAQAPIPVPADPVSSETVTVEASAPGASASTSEPPPVPRISGATSLSPRATNSRSHRASAAAPSEPTVSIHPIAAPPSKPPRSMPFITWQTDSQTAVVPPPQGEGRAPWGPQRPDDHAQATAHIPPPPPALENTVLSPSAVTSPTIQPEPPAPPLDNVRPVTSEAAHPKRTASLPSTGPASAARSATATALNEIVRALRVEHSPRHALALLDQHASELAGDAFSEESLLLRVEAMLALGQRDAVLRLLDHAALTDLGVSSPLLITRGELRAAAHRCAEGIGDFEVVLARSRKPPKQALLGRARCRQQLGDQAGAQADYDRYRREFGEGPANGHTR